VRSIDSPHTVCLSCCYDPRLIGRVDTRQPLGYTEGRSALVLSQANRENDVAKLIGILDLNMLRNVGTIINETVCSLENPANPSMTWTRLTGRNPSLLLVFAFSIISTRNLTTGNIYTPGLILSLYVIAILSPDFNLIARNHSPKLRSRLPPRHQKAKSLNVVYFPQLGGAMAASYVAYWI
jgi:hypothetical protein